MQISAVHMVVEKLSSPLEGVGGGLRVVGQLMAKLYPVRLVRIERVLCP